MEACREGGFAMSAIQFESVVEGNIIRIPEEYVEQVPSMVTVTLMDAGKPRLRPKTKKDLPSIDEFPAMLDTRSWKFDREEIHERSWAFVDTNIRGMTGRVNERKMD
jgi:hypothetical protein